MMTKRERVMRTIRFQETDRVPLYDLLRNDAIIEHYTGEKLVHSGVNEPIAAQHPELDFGELRMLPSYRVIYAAMY